MKIKSLTAVFAAVALLAAPLAANAFWHGRALVAFGVNVSGPEFSPWNGQTFPTGTDFAYLAARGVTYVRLPIAWESLETTLGGSLDATYLSSVQTAIATAWSYGISTIVEIHNFSYYCQHSSWIATVCGYAGNAGGPGTGVNYMGDGTLTQANFNTLWGDIAQALVGTPGVIGYGLMNEPASSVPGTNTMYAPTNLMFGPNGLGDTIGAQPWSVTNSAVVTQLAAGTNPLGAGYGPAWSLTSGSGYGSVAQYVTLAHVPYTFSAYCKVTAGSDANFEVEFGSSGPSHTCTTSWQRFSYTYTPTAGSVQMQLQLNEGAGSTVQIADAQLELGSSSTTYQPNPLLPWLQGAITAIRSYDRATPIYVDGIAASPSYMWPWINWEMATLTGGPLVFDAHYYPDGVYTSGGGGGVFSGTYSSYSINTNNGAQGFAPFIAWCASVTAACYNGEFGIPNNTTDSNDQWLVLSRAFYQQLKSPRVTAPIWFYGSNGVQSANSLNIAPVSATTNGTTASGNATLHFAAVPSKVQNFSAGSTIRDITTPTVIPGGTTILSTTGSTIVMSANATGAGVGSGDVIQVDDLRLTQMLAVP
jgi:hypothetical protein